MHDWPVVCLSRSKKRGSRINPVAANGHGFRLLDPELRWHRPCLSIFPGYQGVVVDERRGKGSDRKGRYRRGRPGYHDPTAGIGGAAPAISALTLRLWLAVFGLVICTAFAIWVYLINAPIGFVVVLLVLAAVAVIDIAVILRRKRRGEPG